MWKVTLLAVIALIAISDSDAPGYEYASAGNSQESTELEIPETLNLDQCIRIALKQSSSMRIANLNLKSAKLDVDDARANYLPEIGVSGQYRFSDDIDFGWERQNYDAQIDANYTIWDHGRRKAQLAQSKANLVSVQTDFDSARQNLIYSITGAYYALLETGKLIGVYEQLLEISTGNIQKAEALQEAGRAIPADIAAARVQQANDELALINARNNLELARAELASRMGLNPRASIEIIEEEEILDYPKIRDMTLKEAVARAIEDRPELERLKARKISLEWSLKLARLDRWPVISAQYDYTVMLDNYLREREDFKKFSNWSAAVRVSFPIFDAGISKRREENAVIALQQLREDIDERERSIMLEVQQAFLGLKRADKSLDIAEEQVRNATLSLNVTQGRYEQDMVIFLEVLSAQARYAQALTNQVGAFYDLKIAEKNLLRSMGALKMED